MSAPEVPPADAASESVEHWVNLVMVRVLDSSAAEVKAHVLPESEDSIAITTLAVRYATKTYVFDNLQCSFNEIRIDGVVHPASLVEVSEDSPLRVEVQSNAQNLFKEMEAIRARARSEQ